MTPWPLPPSPWLAFWREAVTQGRAGRFCDHVLRANVASTDPLPPLLYAVLRLPPSPLTDDELRAR